jgi:hypothetical protein
VTAGAIGSDAMTTVEVPVPIDDVSTPMRKMREWLDQMRFNPLSFTGGRSTAASWCASGQVPAEAVAFAKHFAGRGL